MNVLCVTKHNNNIKKKIECESSKIQEPEGTGKIDFTVFLLSAGLASLCSSLPPSTCFTFTQTHVLLELETEIQ